MVILNKEELVKIFEKFDILDYLDYKPRTGMLTVTKNPFGFINVNKEVNIPEYLFRKFHIENLGEYFGRTVLFSIVFPSRTGVILR